MRVQDVMTENVQTVSPGATAEEAWQLMRQKQVHHLVVTNGSLIVGVVSDRDTGGRHGAAVRQHHRVAELMTFPAATVPLTTTIKKAASMMRGRSIGCLVVEDEGRVRGIVTVSDLLDLLGRGADRQPARTKRWTLAHRVPHRKARRATGVW